MSKKRKPTLFDVFWEIIVKPAWYWLVTIIPAGIAIYQLFGGDEKLIANLPPRVWLVISVTVFVLTVVVSWYIYVRELRLSKESKFNKERNNIRKSVSTKSKARSGGQSIAISGDNYAPINQGTSNIPKSHLETYPNIEVAKFGSEVITLKLVNKIAGETIQVGVGETLERFYVEFVNKKRIGVKTEDAIKVYVTVSFYTTDCKTIKSHDKPRWWVKYDPFDENTWDAEVNLESSGKPQQLFLVLRKINGTQFYIFSRQSHGVPNWIIPELELKDKSNYVHVRLSAKNLDVQDYWILMENHGEGQPLFKLLPESPCGLAN